MKRCEITLIVDSLPTSIVADFDNDEWQVLLDFVEYSLELNQLELIQRGGPAKLTMNHVWGEPVTFTTELPPDDQLYALMHRLRPFILQKESTYFNKTANILTRRIDSTLFQEMIKGLRGIFLANKYHEGFRITVNDGFTLNSEEALQTWLNAFEYHRFREKREIMKEVFEAFPENASRAIFVMLLVDKVHAILALAQNIMVITGQKERFSITI